jgi:hypothetical protein
MADLRLLPDRIAAPDGSTWAALWHGNLVHAEVPDAGAVLEAPRWVVWSGTPAAGLFDESPLVWGSPAWAKFDEALRVVAAAAGPRTVLVRPHARHVVSDLPSCLRVLERTNIPNLRLLLDPASMLTEDMKTSAQDHVTRILEGIAGHPGVDAVVAQDEVVARICEREWPRAVMVR